MVRGSVGPRRAAPPPKHELPPSAELFAERMRVRWQPDDRFRMFFGASGAEVRREGAVAGPGGGGAGGRGVGACPEASSGPLPKVTK